MRKKICVVTGSRADYSLLRGLLGKIRRSQSLRLQLVVTGAHLSRSHGLTIREIIQDGFRIHARVVLPLEKSQGPTTYKSMGVALEGLGRVFARLQPHVVLLLGDRYEIFCAAAAATSLRIPLAHIHGGEVTRGALDDAYRHAITKMSHVHFTATRLARQRVIQMGEPPGNVHWVGAPGLDGIEERGRISKADLEKLLGVCFRVKNLIVTFHPATQEKGLALNHIRELCAALHHFPEARIVFTGVHPDPEGVIIQKEINRFVKTHANSLCVPSLGGEAYLSLLRHVDVVVGNSSSALIEAPSVGCWALNIGSRQEGRERAANVVDVECRRGLIRHHLDNLLRRDAARRKRRFRNPYAGRGTNQKIMKILQKMRLEKNTKKVFFEGSAHND